MDEIDYGAVFGLETEGEQGTEAAEPSNQDEAQGEKEQEAAEPAKTTRNEPRHTQQEDAGRAEETGEQAPDTEQGMDGEKEEEQTPEIRAKFAAARRKAEAERDAAIAKAKEEAQAQAQRMIDEAFANSGLTDPYTKKPITSKAEYDAYRKRFEEEKVSRLLKKSGMTDEEFQALVEDLPQVREAREKQKQAEQAQQQAMQAQAQAKIDEQMKEIAALDPTVKELSDLTKMETYPRFYELVKRGNTLVDAFRLANMDKLTQAAVQASKQAAMNAAQGKQHLAQTAQRGSGSQSVPVDIREAYLAFNPGATEAEIQKHYNRYLNQ